MVDDYCPKTPLECKAYLFYQINELQVSCIRNLPHLWRKKKKSIDTKVFVCLFLWRCFSATILKGLCESKQNRNPMWLTRNDRSWTTANENRWAGFICWNFTSVQKASTGPILPLNLMFQLLKMLTVLHFLGTELRMWARRALLVSNPTEL